MAHIILTGVPLQLPLSNHEGLFDNASPPAGSARGTMSAVDGFRLELAGEDGFGEGGQFLEAQYPHMGEILILRALVLLQL